MTPEFGPSIADVIPDDILSQVQGSALIDLKKEIDKLDHHHAIIGELFVEFSLPNMEVMAFLISGHILDFQ